MSEDKIERSYTCNASICRTRQGAARAFVECNMFLTHTHESSNWVNNFRTNTNELYVVSARSWNPWLTFFSTKFYRTSLRENRSKHEESRIPRIQAANYKCSANKVNVFIEGTRSTSFLFSLLLPLSTSRLAITAPRVFVIHWSFRKNHSFLFAFPLSLSWTLQWVGFR